MNVAPLAGRGSLAAVAQWTLVQFVDVGPDAARLVVALKRWGASHNCVAISLHTPGLQRPLPRTVLFWTWLTRRRHVWSWTWNDGGPVTCTHLVLRPRL